MLFSKGTSPTPQKKSAKITKCGKSQDIVLECKGEEIFCELIQHLIF